MSNALIALGFLAAAVTVYWLPRRAFHRHGYRGAYVGAALLALVIGYGCNAGSGYSPRQWAAMDDQERRGADVLEAVTAAFVVWAGSITIGGVLGACFYRSPVTPPPVASRE